MSLMSECIGNNFILNGELQPTELFKNSMVYDGDSIYEVIRMERGRPVFFNDHLERLKISADLQKKPMIVNSDDLRRDILSLVKSEKQKNINLKIVINYNNSDNYLMYLIQSIYPTKEQYKKGVKGALFFAERKEPESKVINHKLRSEIYNKLLIEGAYEAILVSKNNCITEGGRSNIFFIKDEKLFTAPDRSVLNGITRKHIFGICRENGIDVKFACIKADEISEYESAFMTGTSPVVLPFYCIDNTYFKVNHQLIAILRNMYLIRAEESIRQFGNS
jgi:branched-chain amino acid aminotransferase